MLTNSTLLKLPVDKIIDDYENGYYKIRNQLAEIKRSSDSATEKSLKAIKLTRHYFRTGGKI